MMMNKPLYLLIDGGYLTFQLASNEFIHEKSIEHRLYSHLFWLMDGKDNIRKQEYPEYKANRIGKNVDVRQRVNILRKMVRDTYPHYVDEQLEADDLIALMHYLYPDTPFITIANDKDMLQIPTIQMWERKRDNSIHHKVLENVTLPKRVEALVDTPQALLFFQAMCGDKVDNIISLLVKNPNGRYDYNPLLEYLGRDKPFSNAYADYGNRFYHNLKLVMLPHPMTLSYDSPMALMELLDNWYKDNFNYVQHAVKPKYRDVVELIYPKVAIDINKSLLYNFAITTGVYTNYIEKVIANHVDTQ